MIVWTLVVGLNADGSEVRQAISQHPEVALCEKAGKDWQQALSKLVIGTRVEYTIACVQSDYVLVAKGSDPLKI